jgi:hypothetical protein
MVSIEWIDHEDNLPYQQSSKAQTNQKNKAGKKKQETQEINPQNKHKT